MTIFEWLQSRMIRLRDAGVDSPRRDCLVFVEDLLNKDRSWVLAHHEEKLNKDQIDKLEEKIERRIAREPLAYIRGKAWFYGRFFAVNPSVLIPRPESETFIELLKTLSPKQVFDIGTGSGCIAITAKLELPKTDVIATDLDQKTLLVAKSNAVAHKVTIGFVQTSLLDGMQDFNFSQATIVANLPYVPAGDVSSPEIESEPSIALFSGSDGMDHYRQFWQQMAELKQPPRNILVESLEDQHAEMSELAKAAGYRLSKTEILVQLFEK